MRFAFAMSHRCCSWNATNHFTPPTSVSTESASYHQSHSRHPDVYKKPIILWYGLWFGRCVIMMRWNCSSFKVTQPSTHCSTICLIKRGGLQHIWNKLCLWSSLISGSIWIYFGSIVANYGSRYVVHLALGNRLEVDANTLRLPSFGGSRQWSDLRIEAFPEVTFHHLISLVSAESW